MDDREPGRSLDIGGEDGVIVHAVEPIQSSQYLAMLGDRPQVGLDPGGIAGGSGVIPTRLGGVVSRHRRVGMVWRA
jgi:hypothetical protein